MNQSPRLSGKVVSIRLEGDPRRDMARISLLQDGGFVLDIMVDHWSCMHLKMGEDITVEGTISFRDGRAHDIQAHSITVNHDIETLRYEGKPHPCNHCKKAMVISRLFCAHCDITITQWERSIKPGSPLIPILRRILNDHKSNIFNVIRELPEQVRLATIWGAVNEYTAPAECEDPL